MTRASLLGSAMARATSGFMPKAAIAIAVLTTLGAVVFARASGRQGSEAISVAPLAASLLAWGAGVLLAFAASIRAFDRDRDEGWAALLARHGARDSEYLVVRIAGLALVTLALVLPGTLLSGLTTVLASHDGSVARQALEGTFAAGVYAIAFSSVVAPVALAALGARNRASGYLWLLTLLVLPALVARWTGQFFPEAWSDLVSIPGALDALRESLLGVVDPARALRAIAVLTAVAVLASLWARAQLRLHGSVS